MQEQSTLKKESLEQYFQEFRKDTVGLNQVFESPYGEKKILYADWTASGRLYSGVTTFTRTEF